MAITEPHGGGGSAVCARGGDTSSRRWLQSWPRFSRARDELHGYAPEDAPLQAADAQHFVMDAGEDDGEAPAAGRPALLLEVLPQEQVQQCTAEQIVDPPVPLVPLLHDVMPQMVEQLVPSKLSKCPR